MQKMSLKSKINPHNMRSNEWIMNSPEALVILKSMGSGIGFLFFAAFSMALGFARNWFLMGLFGLLSLVSLKQFISMIKSIKILGFKDVLGGITSSQFIWHRDKNWKKIDGGIENGYEENSEGADTRSSRSDKEDEGGQRQDNSKSERANIRFGEYIQSNDGNSKETTND
ncbi:hypothetical protein LCGC14_2000830 [marine sediment metagenome]|uniref:Uncharacterized protein n=1 Tax=marine sediment metagenome TaxID=412755 RepID=A0A0F9HGQ7_9ZZZZ